MKISRIILLSIVLQIFYSISAFSQVEDFQIWSKVSIKKDVNKKVTFTLQQGFRFKQNATTVTDYLTFIGSQYAFSKKIKVRAMYRYTYISLLEYTHINEHRFYADLLLQHKIENFKLKYRARYQVKYIKFNVNRLHYLRNRFSLEYRIPKTPLSTYAEYEFYYSLNNAVKNSVIRNRYTLGTGYKITDFMSVNIYYRLIVRREYLKIPYNNYILGLGVKFNI